jgi:hypothetical protein
MRKTIFALLIILLPVSAWAEEVAIEGLHGLGTSDHVVFTSEYLRQDYHIFVGLPDGYEADEDRSYPVVYVLDGGLLFPMLRAYNRYLLMGGEIPQLILVGISYGTDYEQTGNNRTHDFTARADGQVYWGGAGDFQVFLGDELFPFIEKHYRARADRRVVFGQSLGGQFVLHAAQTEPGLFWGYIASNPALNRNLGFFIQGRNVDMETGARLYIGAAANDAPQFRAPALRWMDYWIGRSGRPFELKAETLKGHNHFSVPPVAYRRGMIWLFTGALPE